MNPLNNQTRRNFLQLTVASVVSGILPATTLAKSTARPRCYFVSDATHTYWQVEDPIQWALENANQPILERASERLKTLTAEDATRIERLLVRRCQLNLVEVASNHVTVHYWGQTGCVELKPFFKELGLARADVVVVLRERKQETIHTTTGDQYLYGEPLPSDLPKDIYATKWNKRFVQEADDLEPAPCSKSGYAWEGVPSDHIPWKALKSAWRHGAVHNCSNCDIDAMLTNFGNPQISFFGTSQKHIYSCLKCSRQFNQKPGIDFNEWTNRYLDPNVLPRYRVYWDRRIPLVPTEAKQTASESMLSPDFWG